MIGGTGYVADCEFLNNGYDKPCTVARVGVAQTVLNDTLVQHAQRPAEVPISHRESRLDCFGGLSLFHLFCNSASGAVVPPDLRRVAARSPARLPSDGPVSGAHYRRAVGQALTRHAFVRPLI